MFPNIFTRSKIPDELPKSMEDVIKELQGCKTKRLCVKKAYSILSKKYRGYRLLTYLRFFNLFEPNINRIWARTGFLHCVTLNYLMRILLVRSGLFDEGDIRIRWTLVWYISPHQYLNIRLDKNKSINIDLWAKAYHIGFGDYAHGFH
ncbi:hypothetical protein HQ545_04995 [Candidatus Woesearchaeota archaeon]|nr:hypothetical protein [Candidatus Woesearchaeota archaeon]